MLYGPSTRSCDALIAHCAISSVLKAADEVGAEVQLNDAERRSADDAEALRATRAELSSARALTPDARLTEQSAPPYGTLHVQAGPAGRVVTASTQRPLPEH